MAGVERAGSAQAEGQPIRLRLIVCDEHADALERIASVARSLGHDVVALEIAVDAVVQAVREESPELAIVGLHEDQEHALDLVQEIVDENICPVIVQTDDTDPQFVAHAAARGIFAFASPLESGALQAAIEVAVRRFEEFEELSEQLENLEGALRRRAIVERAKGVLMERHAIDEHTAFERLRRRARASNRTVVQIGKAVLEGEALDPERDPG
jgi:AmiR/NasT family two-component response regulator